MFHVEHLCIQPSKMFHVEHSEVRLPTKCSTWNIWDRPAKRYRNDPLGRNDFCFPHPRCPLGPDYRQIGLEHFLVGLAAIAHEIAQSCFYAIFVNYFDGAGG